MTSQPLPLTRLSLAVALVLVSGFFLPLWVGLPVPIPFLTAHYWLPTWV